MNRRERLAAVPFAVSQGETLTNSQHPGIRLHRGKPVNVILSIDRIALVISGNWFSCQPRSSVYNFAVPRFRPCASSGAHNSRGIYGVIYGDICVGVGS